MIKLGKENEEEEFLNKYSEATMEQEIENRLRPIVVGVKNEILEQNMKIEREPNTSISGYDKEDDEFATKVLFNKFRQNKRYQTVVDNEVNYPHNQYSIYTPVDSEIDLDDQFVRTFPILKKHKDQFNIQAKSEFYSMISRQINVNNPSLAWKKMVKKWIWEADVVETLFYYHLMIRQGYSVLSKISAKYKFVHVSVIQQQLQRFAKMFHSTSTIRSNTQFSIDVKQQINQISIVKSAKQLFCAICFIYDCPKHKLQDSIIQDHNQFIHPKNKPILSKKIQSAAELLRVYESIMNKNPNTNKLITENENENENENEIIHGCSKACYLNLNSETFKDLKYEISLILSPIVKAVINLGVQMFYFSPCYIALLSKTKMSCSMVFWYFIKVINIREGILTNFKSPSAYYNEIGLLESDRNNIMESKKKAKRKSLSKRKVTQPNQQGKGPAEQSKEIKSISYTTPMCYHYFLNKDTNEKTETCDNCACKSRGFCLPSCMCPPGCLIRMKGCNCCQVKKNPKNKTDTTKTLKCSEKGCPCRQAQRECHPDVCHGCFPVDKNNTNEFNKIVCCSNNQYQLQIFPKLKIGVSSLTGGGIGLFANQFIPKRSLVIPYSGQAIQNYLQQTRQKVANDQFFYNFAFNQGCIDAKYSGNKARFINHDNDEYQNCYSSIRFAKSDYFLAVYALRDINKDEELFFDYDGFGALFENFRDKYPFIKKRKKPFPKP